MDSYDYNYALASGDFLTIIASFDDDTSRWDAVTSRNTNADGLFVYAVRTTKIFCRPICKARLPRRANVSFFANGHEAQQAGFRACKRCKPEVAGAMPEEAAVRKIRAPIKFESDGEANWTIQVALPSSV
uniref:WGS project CBMI000000000 data, contig CS3069_c004845 n=1 Tax=Fusarium clavum TaxID=2594811 RepID=A0A090N650_9HYPO|nr:unnamed protein product [Fusarium clavum]